MNREAARFALLSIHLVFEADKELFERVNTVAERHVAHVDRRFKNSGLG